MSEPTTEPTPTPPAPTEPATPAKPVFTQPIVAFPDRKFFIKRMVIAAVVIGAGAYSLYDGYQGYPSHNARVNALKVERDDAEKRKDDDTRARLEKQLKDVGDVKSERDIFLQKIIGFVLVPMGLFLLGKFLREGRGELRLEDDTLYAPGHPPVPIRSITDVHNARWDKKGIALFDYALADGKTGRIKLDDFVFTRPPTDAIHDELLAKMPKT